MSRPSTMPTLEGALPGGPRHEACRISEQVQHKPGCTATEDGLRLESLDIGRRGLVTCTLY